MRMRRAAWVILSIVGLVLAVAPVSRAQLVCTESVFDDVSAATVGAGFCGFIEYFATLGITGGCNATPPRFCPDAPVTRGQMAIFISTTLDKVSEAISEGPCTEGQVLKKTATGFTCGDDLVGEGIAPSGTVSSLDGTPTAGSSANYSRGDHEHGIAAGAISNAMIAGPIDGSKISSTGLDADTVDGQHAGAFAPASHAHSGGEITSGTVAEPRIDSAIARASALNTHTSNTNNPHSTTAAQVGAAPTVHSHSGGDITTGTVSEARVDSSVTRDSEVMPIVMANDGAGSGLDADLLDGQHASAFSVTSHNHDTAYVNEGQASSITSAMIQNGSILFADINQNGCGVDQVMKWSGSAWGCAADATGGGDITAVNTSTGLTGGATSGDVTLSVAVPLALSGNASGGGIVSGVNSAATGRGVVGSASGTSGRGVEGTATNIGDVTNYGGVFTAAGASGQGVHAESFGTNGYGVYGLAQGANGRGVFGIASNTGSVQNYGGYFVAAGTSGRGVRGEANANAGVGVEGIAFATGAGVFNYGGIFTAYGGVGVGVVAVATGYTGVSANGGVYDFYAGGSGINYGPFTGGHEVKLSENFPANVTPGMIVSVTGRTQVRRRDDGTVTLSSTLPTVKLSKAANDKTVFGVLVSEAPLPAGHWYGKKEGERFATVNALGEGRVWVTNLNGNIEAGDYITTSNLEGYGQRQEDDVLHTYTLGKAIETVDWDMVAETISFEGRTYKIYLIAVVYTSG